MRMRKKPNLVPRMERCAATLITDPEALRGHWLEHFPGHQALQLELGCGKGRFTADTAAQNPDIFLAAIEKVPDAMVVGMERVTERGLENVRFLDRDAANLLDMFAPGEVSRIYINFPDPWKKSRQHKRRLTYAGFLALYANVLPLGGEDAALRACLPQVLRRGTARLNDMQAFGTALDELYGARIEAAVRKEGENLCIGFLSDCIDETYAPGADGLTAGVIGLLCDLLYDPYLQDGLFCAAYVEGERGNLIDRIAALKNDPRSWAPRRLNELMCENENYGKSALGTIEQAERITPETLYVAYRRALSEAQVELFYCGTMMPDEVEAHFMATPLAQPREGTLYQPHMVVQARPAGDVREVVEDAEVTQGKLSLGFRTGGAWLGSDNAPAYWLFQTAFGGSTSSRLFLNVREKKSLCYYASAQFVTSKGLLLVNSGIENANFAVARDEILHQLDECRAGALTDAELDTARKTLANGWRAMLDDPLTLERSWLGQAASGLLIPPEKRIEQISAVTPEQVTAAAQNTALDTVYFMKGAAR